MRNIEVMRNYFLGRDPQLKETLADNSLRLIGIEGRHFVLRTELMQRLKELKEYLDDKDKEMAEAIQGVINDLNAEINNRKSADNALGTRIDNETLARQNADTALGNRVSTIEYWKNNNNFVMLDDLVTALANYYTKSEVNSLIAAIPTLTYEIVETLPTTNISTRTIYMVFQTGAQEPDFYNEYLYIGDTTQPYDPGNWELIGTTRIDLSNYYTKSEVDAITFTKTLTQDITVSDASPEVAGLSETGWYYSGEYKIYNSFHEPVMYEHTLFYYNEGVIWVLPPTVSDTSLCLSLWYDYDNNVWQYAGWDIVGNIDHTSTDMSIPTAGAVFRILLMLLSQIPTATAEGETINVQDSSNLPPKDFNPLGNATQQTYTGKNLFNGYTIGKTLNNNTGEEADSTTAAVSDYIPVNFTTNPNYYLSGLTNTLHSNIWAYNSSKQGLGRTGNQARTEIKLTSSSFTSGTPQGTGDIAYIRITQRYDTGDTGSISVVNTLKTQLEVGSSATSYEPYTGGTPAPNPDYPQDIHVVTGDNTVEVVRKNLFDKETAIADKRLAQDGKLSSDSGYYTSDFIKIIASTQYTKNSPTADAYHRVCFYTSNDQSTFISKSESNTFTTPSNANYLRFCGISTELNTAQLEQGSTATQYEPYTEQTQLLSLGSIELAKIGDYIDRPFKAQAGLKFYDSLPDSIKANLTLGKWYEYSAIIKYTFVGAETESITRDSTGTTGQYRFYINVDTPIDNGGTDYVPKILCNRLFAIDRNSTYNCAQGISTYVSSQVNRIIVYTDNTKAMTVNEFKTWLSSNNLIVYVVLATPTTTEITDTTLKGQLENILSMHTNKNVTNAWIEPSGTNAQAGLTLTYYQDLETIIGEGGGGGGTTDYDDLTDKPSINSVELSGNKTSADLGIPAITYGTTDLTPGVSPLNEGEFYFVYE